MIPSTISILLVEDNEHDRAVFARALSRSKTSFEISSCERTEDALETLQADKNSFDLIVCDYDLPGMTGMELYRQLRHMKNLPPFVLLTGAGSENLAVEALQAGIYDYIIKDPGQGYLTLLPLKLVEVIQRKSERKARRKAQADLKKAHEELERKVAERTAELSLTVQALEEEIAEHQQARKQISIAYDALKSAGSGIILTDTELRIRFANIACQKIFNFKRLDDIIGQNAAPLFSEDKIKTFIGVKLVVDRSTGEARELIVQRTDDTKIPVEIYFSEVRDSEGAVVGKMASLLDITARKKTESALRESEMRLRELSRKILNAQENERKLMAQEIHDSISGSLAAVKMFLEEKLAKMTHEPPDDIVYLEKIIAMIGQTIQETRRISAHLRPSILDDMGLFPTIRWFCREFEKYYPAVRVVSRLEIDEADISEQLKIVIYRVLQEAMNNVGKHSEASQVRVQLMKSGKEMHLFVEDNGRGLDMESLGSSIDPMSGFGLSNMRDRAEICGGRLEIISELGVGTTIQLILPSSGMSRML